MCGVPRIAGSLIGSLLLAALGGATAWADEMRDLLEQALDQPVEKLSIENLPLPEAVAKLEQETGVGLKLSPDILELMPYGAGTRVSLMIEKLPVRQGLTQLLDGLGLTMRPSGGSLIVEPGPALLRLGRRITAQEVALLGKLAAGPWTAAEQEHIALRAELPPGAPPDLMGELTKQLASARGVNALRAFESVTQNMGLAWVPDGDGIVIRTIQDDTQRRLDVPIDAAYQRMPLDRLLVDLGRRQGLTMYFAPGSLQQISARDRNVDLVQRGVSVRQILEMICGNTGLKYSVVPNGVEFVGPQAGANSKGPTGEMPAHLVRLSVPLGVNNITVDCFLRETELPPPLRALLDTRLQQLLDQLTRAAAATPAAAGADSPADPRPASPPGNPLSDPH